MRCLLFFFLAVTALSPAICQVNSAEYFIDADPGTGKATALSIISGDTISKDFTLTVSSLAPGFHSVSLRAKDARGLWSHTYTHSFFMIANPASGVTANEYYIDTDPGIGKATNIPAAVGSDSSLNYIVSLSAYNAGFHTIGLRSKDNLGRWSQTKLHAFYMDENNAPVNISSLQYYFTGSGATDSIYTYEIPVPAASVDLDIVADLSQLVEDREYAMHIWAINAKGIRSQVFIKTVKVCNGDVAKAKFEFVQSGNQVSFIDNSVGGSGYAWNFGDGKTDTTANPFHNYLTVGVYNVRLIVSNFCNSDTLTKVVSVFGLKSIFTDHGGDSGSVSVNIAGAGFVPGTQVYLHKSGQPDIYGDTLIIADPGLMSTTFNLSGQAHGLRDVIVVFPNGIRDTLHSGFTIEGANDPKLWVNISGPGVLRIGFNQVYTITYGNKGNSDAVLVPLLISGLPLGTDIEILDPIFRMDTISNYKSFKSTFDSLHKTIDDSSQNQSFRMLYIANIPAGSVGTINLVFHVPVTTVLHTHPVIDVIIGRAIAIEQAAGLALKTSSLDYSSLAECGASLFDLAGSAVLDIIGVDDWRTCIIGVAGTFESAINFVMSLAKKEDKRKIIFDGGDFFVSTAESLVGCAKVGAAFIPVGAAGKAALALIEAALKGASYGFKVVAAINACSEAYKKNSFADLRPIIGNATDPNEKYGPGDSSNRHFTNMQNINYVISFENTPTANLNAQTITVVDTLSSSYFDFPSFGFTSVTVGDSVYSLPNPVRSFVHDFDFTSLYGVKARVSAHFDTATGIAQWKFLTIDPVTNQATTDALAGFLPPDVNSPKGQGYISYTVNPKQNIQTGDSIKNTAFIKFDFNPVIATNSWANVFDFINPVSHVVSQPAEVYDTTFTVQWSGTDNASGVRSYDVYYKVNNGAYQLWQYDITVPENNFTGQKDSTYSFFSISKDYAGNIEPAKSAAETVVTVKLYDSSNNICPGTNTIFNVTAAGAGYTYSWQVSQGGEFTDISNSIVYSGTNTSQLTLTIPPTVYSKYKYRCRISNGTITYYSSIHAVKFEATWMGTVGNAWETPGNWNCGVVPDENTDVVIPKTISVSPVLNENGTCKSLTINQQSSLLVKTGVKLTITGKL